MKKCTFLFASLMLFAVIAKTQTATDNNLITIKLRINVVTIAPVGWGHIFKGIVEEVIEGNKMDFTDTIEFGITAQKKFEFLKVQDVRIITFNITGEINNNSYFPPIDGALNKHNEIMLITTIEEIK